MKKISKSFVLFAALICLSGNTVKAFDAVGKDSLIGQEQIERVPEDTRAFSTPEEFQKAVLYLQDTCAVGGSGESRLDQLFASGQLKTRIRGLCSPEIKSGEAVLRNARNVLAVVNPTIASIDLLYLEPVDRERLNILILAREVAEQYLVLSASEFDKAAHPGYSRKLLDWGFNHPYLTLAGLISVPVLAVTAHMLIKKMPKGSSDEVKDLTGDGSGDAPSDEGLPTEGTETGEAAADASGVEYDSGAGVSVSDANDPEPPKQKRGWFSRRVPSKPEGTLETVPEEADPIADAGPSGEGEEISGDETDDEGLEGHVPFVNPASSTDEPTRVQVVKAWVSDLVFGESDVAKAERVRGLRVQLEEGASSLDENRSALDLLDQENTADRELKAVAMDKLQKKFKYRDESGEIVEGYKASVAIHAKYLGRRVGYMARILSYENRLEKATDEMAARAIVQDGLLAEQAELEANIAKLQEQLGFESVEKSGDDEAGAAEDTPEVQVESPEGEVAVED